MHVLVLQTGVIAAVIYGDSHNEVRQELPLGILGNIWAVVGPQRPLRALKASMGPQGREEVSLALHCEFDCCAIMR